MPNFADDPAVHDRLFRQYDYLQDFPLNIKGKFIEDAVNLGVLETDDFLGFMMGYPVEKDSAGGDRFPFLSPEENQKIAHYQLIHPVIPWPHPVIGIQNMTVTGTHGVDVVMKDCGSIQLWWGQDVGVFWECLLEGIIQQRQDFEAIMNQAWSAAESVLRSHGVKKVVTHNRDPEYPLDWYQSFLKRLGYEPIAGKEFAVQKELD